MACWDRRHRKWHKMVARNTERKLLLTSSSVRKTAFLLAVQDSALNNLASQGKIPFFIFSQPSAPYVDLWVGWGCVFAAFWREWGRKMERKQRRLKIRQREWDRKAVREQGKEKQTNKQKGGWGDNNTETYDFSDQCRGETKSKMFLAGWKQLSCFQNKIVFVAKSYFSFRLHCCLLLPYWAYTALKSFGLRKQLF